MRYVWNALQTSAEHVLALFDVDWSVAGRCWGRCLPRGLSAAVAPHTPALLLPRSLQNTQRSGQKSIKRETHTNSNSRTKHTGKHIRTTATMRQHLMPCCRRLRAHAALHQTAAGHGKRSATARKRGRRRDQQRQRGLASARQLAVHVQPASVTTVHAGDCLRSRRAMGGMPGSAKPAQQAASVDGHEGQFAQSFLAEQAVWRKNGTLAAECSEGRLRSPCGDG
jgi:hypothetical protein